MIDTKQKIEVTCHRHIICLRMSGLRDNVNIASSLFITRSQFDSVACIKVNSINCKLTANQNVGCNNLYRKT